MATGGLTPTEDALLGFTDFANFTFENARRARNCSTGTAIVGTALFRRAGFRMPISGNRDHPYRVRRTMAREFDENLIFTFRPTHLHS